MALKMDCSVCLDAFQTDDKNKKLPRVFGSCGHTFCVSTHSFHLFPCPPHSLCVYLFIQSQCMLNLTKAPNAKCPICRAVCQKDMKELRTNVSLLELLVMMEESVRAQESTHMKAQAQQVQIDLKHSSQAGSSGVSSPSPAPMCQECKEARGEIQCKNCDNMLYCSTCFKQKHPKKKKAKPHTFSVLTVSPIVSPSPSRPVPPSSSKPTCQKHDSLPFLLYCQTCSVPICLVCREAKAHKEHSICAAEDAIEAVHSTLTAQVSV